MRRLAPVIALIAVMAIAGTATARPNSKLQTFGTGQVSINGGTVMITNGAGDYGGVYLKSRSLSSKRLRAVHLSFVSSAFTTGGAPRFSIPLNTGHAENTAPYAFIDVNNCGGTPGTATTVSTDNHNCKVFLNFDSSASFANWDSFAAAHPDWRLAKAAIPFIIADQPGTYQVSQIHLR